jgi:hypothetical protein
MVPLADFIAVVDRIVFAYEDVLFEGPWLGEAELAREFETFAAGAAPDLHHEHAGLANAAMHIELCAGDDDRQVPLLAGFLHGLAPERARWALDRVARHLDACDWELRDREVAVGKICALCDRLAMEACPRG